jgi:hypothetical protein
MKYNKIFFGVLIATTGLVGCTKDFEQVNVNPTTLPDLATDILFTQATLATSGGEYEAWRTNLIYNTQFVQQFASLSWAQGDKYEFNEGYNSALWDAYYGDAIKNLTNLVEKTNGVAADVNYNSAARILKAFAFLRLTDSYGDIPYSEAGKGFVSGVFAPKYDEQRTILADLINELDAAAKAFDASRPFRGDVSSYNGNVTLWRKAAYSLMLRVAMRMSKKDAAAAQAGVQRALAGGLVADANESFRIRHLPGAFANPNSVVLGYFAGGRNELSNDNFKFSKTFIDWLRTMNDPRLRILSVVRTGPSSSPNIGTENDDMAIQKGLPNGTNPNGFSGLATFSQLRSSFADPDDPNILVSHGQTLLLLAEARERGWITAGTAEQYFRDGVRSSINQLRLYNPSAALFDDAAINTYVTGLMWPATQAERLRVINEQYYVTSLLDGYEPHANWRRSGHPALTPVNFAGNYTNGVIPRRFQYPASELGLNGANLQAAITRQGANNWTTRVWWDSN